MPDGFVRSLRPADRRAVRADDDGHRSAEPAGLCQLPLEGPPRVVRLAGDAAATELREPHGDLLAGCLLLDGEEDIRPRCLHVRDAFLLHREEEPLDPGSEANARSRRSPDLLHEVVVAASARESRVLVLQRADELPRRARVVVEAANESRNEGVSHSDRVEVALDDGEELAAGRAQRLTDLRCLTEGCAHPIGLRLVVVEHAQRARRRLLAGRVVEAIGSDDPSVDAELIQLYDALLRRLGISRYHLDLNSIGCRECRPAYLERLRAWLEANAARLDEPTREKAVTSPLRVFDNYQAKPDAVRAALDEAPKIGDSLCAACRERFDVVRRDLDAVGVSYTLVPTLVRGLDYYSRTTWEFVGPLENENATLSGGGRYDYLVEEIGGPATPGVGFGAGIERLLLAMEEEGVAEADAPATDVFFAVEPGAPRQAVAAWLAELRQRGISCDTEYAGRSLKGQLTQAGRLGAATTVVVGAEVAAIRRAGSEDETVPHAELLGRLAT